jgi:SAM-dependent methyltransferase
VYRVLACGHCEHMQTLGVPPSEALEEIYPPRYVARSLGGTRASWRQRLLNHFVSRIDRKRARLLRRSVQLDATSKVLDAGCNNGSFLSELHRQTGCRCVGIEADRAAARQAAGDSALDIRCGRIEALMPLDAQYDVVTLWHVLEHLREPVELLCRAGSAVRRGGYLIVAVPDASGWTARLFGRVWFGLDVPRHISHFTRRTLWSAFHVAGWRPLRFEYVTELSTVSGSLHNLLGLRWCDDLPANVLKWIALQGLGMPIDLLFRLLGGGDWMVALARKD